MRMWFLPSYINSLSAGDGAGVYQFQSAIRCGVFVVMRWLPRLNPALGLRAGGIHWLAFRFLTAYLFIYLFGCQGSRQHLAALYDQA